MKSSRTNGEPGAGSRKPVKSSIRRKLLVSLLVALSSVLLVEGAARVVGEPPGPFKDAEDPAAIHAQFLVNGWLVQPLWSPDDCHEYGRDVLGGKTPSSADGEVEVSAQGFRDTLLAMPKPAGQIRILLLGDSSVFGAGICRLDTLSELLETGLNEGMGEGLPGGHRKVEVINAGVPGYSTYQSLELLRRAKTYGLDGVIVYNLISDMKGTPGVGDDTWFASWGPLLRVLGRSAAVRWADYLATPFVKEVRHTALSAGPPEGNRVDLRTYMDNLREIVDEVQAVGGWVGFVIPPLSSDVAQMVWNGKWIGLSITPESPDPHPDAPVGIRPREYVIQSERQAEEVWGALREKIELVDNGVDPDFVPEDYRDAMALVGWEGEHTVLNGPMLLHTAAEALGEHGVGTADSLMLDIVHPAPAGNRLMADALLPLIAAKLDL